MRITIAFVAVVGCSYSPSAGSAGDPDQTPDSDPGTDAMVTPVDGPPADTTTEDGPVIAACSGYAPLVGGSPIGATYRGFANGAAWATARANCQADGADLVVIDDAEEAAAVTTLVDDNQSPYHWVGLHDNPATNTDNDFISVRGGPAVFDPWGNNQPSGGNENCVLVGDFGAPFELYDFNCGAPQVYVCECLP